MLKKKKRSDLQNAIYVKKNNILQINKKDDPLMEKLREVLNR